MGTYQSDVSRAQEAAQYSGRSANFDGRHGEIPRPERQRNSQREVVLPRKRLAAESSNECAATSPT
jgi:hypothetical protein